MRDGSNGMTRRPVRRGIAAVSVAALVLAVSSGAWLLTGGSAGREGAPATHPGASAAQGEPRTQQEARWTPLPAGDGSFAASAVHHDLSAPLASLISTVGAPSIQETAARAEAEAEAESDGDAAPARIGAGDEAEKAREASLPRPLALPTGPDPVIQKSKIARQKGTAAGTSGGASALVAMPPIGSGWMGLGNGFTGPGGTMSVQYSPPDTSMDVSPTQIIEVVNVALAVFDKSGTVLKGPVPVNTLWSGFGGLCESTNDGDATAQWDRLANRWVVSQFAVSGASGSASNPYLQCVAVSQTADAMGAWYRYAFPYTYFNDYPHLAVWPDAYYTTFNGFSNSGFLGGYVCAYERARMLTGLSARQVCSPALGGSILVAGVEGSLAPPDGRDAYGIRLASSGSLDAYRFHVNWTPSTPTLTTTGPTSLTVAPFTGACSGSFWGSCVPQPGTTNKLDTLGDRVMYRYVYRMRADGTESLLVSHTASVSGVHAVRWYELYPSGSGVAVRQQSTYSPDTVHRWMPSIAMDKEGGIALVYSASSSSLYPEIRYAGRLLSDPLGTLGQNEATVIAGGGSQNSSLTRWGDYAAIAVDPSDDCTFWTATEYLPGNGAWNWRTRIASFTFAGCGAPVAPSITAQPASQTITAGQAATFTAYASGSPLPSVQWQSSTDGSTWTSVGGATSSTYSFITALSDSGTQYRAVFTNDLGTATSSAATLTVIPAYPLQLTKVGSGTVTSSPAGITCSPTCAASSTTFAEGTPVSLTATAAAGYTFTSWAGCDATSGTRGSICGLTMNAIRSVTATFDPIPAPTIASFSPASGPTGTSVTINGTAFTGATAVRFNGTSASFSVVSDGRVTATVPSSATSGAITVVTGGGTATSGSSFTVTKIGTAISAIGPLSATRSKSVKLTATLKSSGGSPIASATLSFTFNSRTYTAKTNTSGVATTGNITAPSIGGSYAISVSYAGSATYASSSASASMTVL